MNKIFCIGLPKTGTTSMNLALQRLGYTCAPYDSELIETVAAGNLTYIDEFISRYDAFEDWPWPFIYEYLIKEYPEAKFILTTRSNPNTWYQSILKHTKRNPSKKSLNLRKVFYQNQNVKDSEHYKQFYLSHNTNVINELKNKNISYIKFCAENGDDYTQLCEFLNITPLKEVYPHSNKAENSRKK